MKNINCIITKNEYAEKYLKPNQVLFSFFLCTSTYLFYSNLLQAASNPMDGRMWPTSSSLPTPAISVNNDILACLPVAPRQKFQGRSLVYCDRVTDFFNAWAQLISMTKEIFKHNFSIMNVVTKWKTNFRLHNSVNTIRVLLWTKSLMTALKSISTSLSDSMARLVSLLWLTELVR